MENRAIRTKRVAVHIIVIEDESSFSEYVQEWIPEFIDSRYEPIMEVVSSIDKAVECLRSRPYSIVMFDIRMPLTAGGVVEMHDPALWSPEVEAERRLPLALGIIWSNFTDRHPRAGMFSGRNEWAYWSKGVEPADRKPELPHYTAKEGCEVVGRMLALWPGQKGESLVRGEIDWGTRYFRRSRDWMPEQLGVAAGALEILGRSPTNAQALVSLPTVFEFCEWGTQWLWAVSACLVRDGGISSGVDLFSGSIPGRALSRKMMQDNFSSALELIAAGKMRKNAELWLRFLGRWDGPAHTLDIVDALEWIREERNNWAHAGQTGVAATRLLSDLAVPVRKVMDVVSFIAAYPLVTDLERIRDTSWRLECVRGTYPWPLREWELELPANFEGREGHVYQVWPRGDGLFGLLDLWPWLECRADKDRRRKRVWFAMGRPDGRRIVERSFNDLREIIFDRGKPPPEYDEMSNDRWRRLCEM